MVVSTGAVIAATTSEWGVGLLDDLDRPLVELAEERVLLELRQLVCLRHLGEIGRADRAGLLGLLEQLPDVLDDEDALDVGLTHAGQGDARLSADTLSHSEALCLGSAAKIPRGS